MSEQAAWRDGFSNIARFASLSRMKRTPDEMAENLAARRLLRFILQSAARELLPKERVASCLRAVIPPHEKDWKPTDHKKTGVQVLYSAKWQRAFYGNLAQCASIWVDPVCSSKITERRRVEMAGVLAGSKYYQLMATRTFQHSCEDRLTDLQLDFSEAKRRVKAGKGWADIEKRFGVIGSISGTEVTYSLKNGFHLHDHSDYLFKAEIGKDDFREVMLERYAAAMRDRGRYVSSLYGLDVRETNDAVTDYVSKWGVDFELAKYPTKQARAGHYSAFQLLQLYTEGVSWAGPVFREYAAAMKGKKQLVWSRGLRDILEAGREVSDLELVEAAEEDAKTLAWLSLAQWKIILRHEKRGELLEVASLGSYADLSTYLRSFGIYLES